MSRAPFACVRLTVPTENPEINLTKRSQQRNITIKSQLIPYTIHKTLQVLVRAVFHKITSKNPRPNSQREC